MPGFTVQTMLEPYVATWTQVEESQLDAEVEADHLLDAVGELKRQQWGYLAAITGLDNGTDANTFSILYHFCSGEIVLTLRINTPRESAAVDSISDIYPNAVPFERETGEMFGITFASLPDSSYLFLPDDWPEGRYPLRKDEVTNVQSE